MKNIHIEIIIFIITFFPFAPWLPPIAVVSHDFQHDILLLPDGKLKAGMLVTAITFPQRPGQGQKE